MQSYLVELTHVVGKFYRVILETFEFILEDVRELTLSGIHEFTLLHVDIVKPPRYIYGAGRSVTVHSSTLLEAVVSAAYKVSQDSDIAIGCGVWVNEKGLSVVDVVYGSDSLTTANNAAHIAGESCIYDSRTGVCIPVNGLLPVKPEPKRFKVHVWTERERAESLARQGDPSKLDALNAREIGIKTSWYDAYHEQKRLDAQEARRFEYGKGE